MSLTIFQQKLAGTTSQLIAENLNVFNAASGGALVLGNGQVVGDTVEELNWGLIAGLVNDREAYAPAGTSAQLKVMARLLSNSINLDAKVGPFVVTSGMLDKINRSVDEATAEFASQASQAIIQRYINTAVGALAAAIGTAGAADAVFTQAANVGKAGAFVPTLSDFARAAGLFGDAVNMLRTWFLTGAQWSNLIAEQVIPNAATLFTIGNINVMGDGLGRRFVVSDVATLTQLNAILGLTPSAATITTTGLTLAAGQVLGDENIANVVQGEFSYNVALKGYKIKKSVSDAHDGIASYKLADATTGANWERYKGEVDKAPLNFPVDTSTGAKKKQTDQAVPVLDVKQTAGVMLKLTAQTAKV